MQALKTEVIVFGHDPWAKGEAMSKGEKPILSVRIDQKVMDRLDMLCERAGVGRAEMVERCLSVGIIDQEEFVSWLESSVQGPMLNILLHPKVLASIFSITGHTVDETQMKVKKHVTERRKAGGKGKPATA
jgi:metal-responsive CopG/Arc/MetJ family transcriptional regulator